MSGRIDEFFKEKLSASSSHEFQQQYWEQAEAMLDGKKPKRKVWMWLLPLFLVGIVGGSLLFFNGNEELSSQLEEAKTNIATSALQVPENSSKFEEESQAAKGKSVSIDEAEVITNDADINLALEGSTNTKLSAIETEAITNAKVKTEPAKANNKSTQTSSVASKKNSKAKFVPTVVLAANTSNTVLTNNQVLNNGEKRTTTKVKEVKTDAKVVQKSETPPIKTYNQLPQQVTASLNYLPTIASAYLKTNTNHLPLKSLKTSLENDLLEEDKKATGKDASKEKLFKKITTSLVLDVYGGVGLKSSSFKANNADGERIANFRKGSEVNQLNSVAGINLRYMLSDNFSVGGGIQFDELREEVNYNLVEYQTEDYHYWNHFFKEVYEIVPRTNQGGTNFYYDTIFYRVSDSVWTHKELITPVQTSYHGINAMRFVDIPFMIGVHGKLGKKWGYDVFAGGSLGYLVSSKGAMPNSDLSNYKSVKDNNLWFRRPIVSSFIQPGIHYNLTNNINLNFSPRVKANLTPLLNHNDNYTQRLFGGDLTMGMSYKF